MKKIVFMVFLLGNHAFAQIVEKKALISQVSAPLTGLTMTSDYGVKDAELFELLRFDNIDYYKISFNGKDLRSKSFSIRVKEIWNGNVKRDTLVINSRELTNMGLDVITDTTFSMKVIGKWADKKLKVSFIFPRFSTTREYSALQKKDYSLRNLADESKLPIGYNQKINFMAYILPYERNDGSKSWCDVGGSGKDVENWGKKFGIKHYLLFELRFD